MNRFRLEFAKMWLSLIFIWFILLIYIGEKNQKCPKYDFNIQMNAAQALLAQNSIQRHILTRLQRPSIHTNNGVE